MLRFLGNREVKTPIQAHFIPDVDTYDIICEIEDESVEVEPVPRYRVANAVMIWLEEDGTFVRLETISPQTIDHAPCTFADKLIVNSGFPRFEVVVLDNDLWLQQSKKGFIVWLAKGKMVDEQIKYDTLVFFLANKELVAIEAQEMIIEQ